MSVQFTTHVLYGILSNHGIGVDGDKVKAVLEERQSSNATEIRSFCVNFNSRFISNLATIAEPLRRLTRSRVKFQWENEQENAFKKLKEKSKSMYISILPKAVTKVIADASPVGHGAVLVQKQGNHQKVYLLCEP